MARRMFNGTHRNSGNCRSNVHHGTSNRKGETIPPYDPLMKRNPKLIVQHNQKSARKNAHRDSLNTTMSPTPKAYTHRPRTKKTSQVEDVIILAHDQSTTNGKGSASKPEKEHPSGRFRRASVIYATDTTVPNNRLDGLMEIDDDSAESMSWTDPASGDENEQATVVTADPHSENTFAFFDFGSESPPSPMQDNLQSVHAPVVVKTEPADTSVAPTVSSYTSTDSDKFSPPFSVLSVPQAPFHPSAQLDYNVWLAKHNNSVRLIQDTLRDEKLCVVLGDEHVRALKTRLVELMLK